MPIYGRCCLSHEWNVPTEIFPIPFSSSVQLNLYSTLWLHLYSYCGWGFARGRTSDWSSMLHHDCPPCVHLGKNCHPRTQETSWEQLHFCMVRSFPSIAMLFWPIAAGNSSSFRLWTPPCWHWLYHITVARHLFSWFSQTGGSSAVVLPSEGDASRWVPTLKALQMQSRWYK